MTPVRVIALFLVPVLAAGCTSGEAVNPNLLTPKLVVDVLPTGEMTLYLRSAFGDQRYDSLSMRLDNDTLVEREHAFSLEQTIDARSVFVHVEARAGESHFMLRGNLALNETATRDDRIEASFVDAQDAWGERRVLNVPFERYLDRVEVRA